jgi:phosphoribosylanthranilate isomerase
MKMVMLAVKICGLSTIEHALAAAVAGADMVGMVFVPVRRQVSPEQAATIVGALRQHPAGEHVRTVGLFVNEQTAHINEIAAQCGLDYIQLSGDETPQQAVGIHAPLIKSLRLDGGPVEQEWLRLAQSSVSPEQPAMIRVQGGEIRLAPCPLIVDAHVAGAYGGTGTLADWQRAAVLAQQQPFLLAGGLKPDNVAEAIAQVQPYGVDVSSGVEVDGRKDTALIESFIHTARAASLQR